MPLASVHVEASLCSQAFRCDFPSRRKQVRVVVARIATWAWLVDCQVDRDVVAIGNVPRERACQLDALCGCQLDRQRDLIFARYPGVSPLLDPLGGIPQAGPIACPLHAVGHALGHAPGSTPGRSIVHEAGRRAPVSRIRGARACGGESRGQHDLLMQDILAMRMVIDPARALIVKALTRTVRRSSYRAAADTSAHGTDSQAIDGHLTAPLPPLSEAMRWTRDATKTDPDRALEQRSIDRSGANAPMAVCRGALRRMWG
jgi:hypothetical protein